jgi:hypothetical protein
LEFRLVRDKEEHFRPVVLLIMFVDLPINRPPTLVIQQTDRLGSSFDLKLVPGARFTRLETYGPKQASASSKANEVGDLSPGPGESKRRF